MSATVGASSAFSSVGISPTNGSHEMTNEALRDGMGALSRYFIGDAPMGETLLFVANLVKQALPQSDLVGITMIVDEKVGTFVFTDPEISEIDQAQYETGGKGPCVDSFRTGEVFVIDSMETDDRWPEFAATARAHGVLSSLSLPMNVAKTTVGAMNIYARAERAFGPEDVETGYLFATQAGVVLANAQAYWGARTLAENLESALASRSVIEQAKGMIMNAQRKTADEAFQILVAQSQHENVKLRTIAERLVSGAGRR